MKFTDIIVLFLLTCSCLQAQEKRQNPVQPWSKYRVHDVTRPHPPKAERSAVVTTQAPVDADVIFNGKNTSALTKGWIVKDGIMIASKSGNNATKKSYGSCQLHIEWRIPAGRKVKGQKGGNSGVFLMGLYEVQIQESHTNQTYADGQAAAIYGQYPPLVNASLPQGEWQSYDITFIAPEYKGGKLVKPAMITAIHNGVLVHEAQELHGPTVFRKVASYPKSHPKKAPLKLQWHNDPVEFRNIWIRELKREK